MNRRKSIKSLLVGLFGGLFVGNTLKATSSECKFTVNKSSDITSILSYKNKHGEEFQLLENEYGDLCVYRDEEQIMRLHSLKHIESIPDSIESEFDSHGGISLNGNDVGDYLRVRSTPNLSIKKNYSSWGRILND